MPPTLPGTGDPRWLQVIFLAGFLLFGLGARDFPLWHGPLVFASGLFTQWACVHWLLPLWPAPKVPAGEVPATGAWTSGSSLFLSAAITCFGLTLLLRTDRIWVAAAAPAVGIAGKFLLRVRGRHLFNPAGLGLCAVLLATPHAWVSPAQWGEQAAGLLCLAALGLLVAHRSFRSDLSLSFLCAWGALRAARVLWLGQRGEVLWHQLAQPSLLIFAFFMISDPKTTPERRTARLAYAVTVAGVAFALQHRAFVQSPLVWALLLCAPLVPLFDRAAGRLTKNLRITNQALPTTPAAAISGAPSESPCTPNAPRRCLLPSPLLPAKLTAQPGPVPLPGPRSPPCSA